MTDPHSGSFLNAPSPASLRGYAWTARITRPFFLALAYLGVPLFVAILVYSATLTMHAEHAVLAADNSAIPAAQQTNITASQADLQKAVNAAVDASLKRDELLLDKLLLLVGVYATILSFLALATAIVSRQDAKEQLAGVKASADALAASIEKQLGEIRANAQNDVKALQSQIKLEFPIISQLQSRVLDLILKLEAKYPDTENWNIRRPHTWKTEVQQQDVLIDELQIVAVSVVVLDDADLFKLYLVLARSYLDRFRTGALDDGDAARAYLYSSRAIQSNPQSAEGYRMRGVCGLSRYESANAERKKSDGFHDLLQSAKADFVRCKALDPHNAGAYYNLALIVDSEGDRSEAIRLSEEILSKAKDVPRSQREKYFADVYINLACYFAEQAGAQTDPTLKQQSEQKVLDVCTEGRNYLQDDLKSSKAMDHFKFGLGRELGPTGDFAQLSDEIKEAIHALQ